MFQNRSVLVYLLMTVLVLLAFNKAIVVDAFVQPQIFITRRRTLLSAERQPWNIFQFAQQSLRFVNLGQRPKARITIQPGDLLWKPGFQNDFTFAPLDDVVMGGASSSNFDTATGQWNGVVTDANNGGFIGIRSTPVVDWNMSNCQGIEVTLNTRSTNTPLRIKVVVRDSTEFNGISWTTSIDVVNGKPTKIPFAKQVPTVFARTVPNSKPFAKDQVKGIQLVYSKFEYDGKLNDKFALGNFQLQIDEIRAY